MLNVAFLGFCDRASYTREGPFVVQNIIGLRTHVLSHIYPVSIANWKFAFALYMPIKEKLPEVRFFGPDGKLAFGININLQPYDATTPPPGAMGPVPVSAEQPEWVMATVKSLSMCKSYA